MSVGGLGCEPTQEIRRFTLASRATRLLRVPSMLPSISFGTPNWVLAGFRSRSLKSHVKKGPNRNGRGSPKLRLRAILSPASARRRVYEVRLVPANPFDNTENSVPIGAVSPVRNGDNGGGDDPGDQLSPVQVSTAQDRFEILRAVEGQNSRPPGADELIVPPRPSGSDAERPRAVPRPPARPPRV